MVKLIGNFSCLRPEKVMVVGDLLLDTYTIGKARRISPEAPVAVVHVQKEESRPGGAGNAILNLISLGANVVALGRVGKDFSGEFLKKALSDEGVDTRGIVTENSFKTPIKNRIIAENQQIVRVDHEQITPLSEEIEEQIIALLPELLKEVKAVAISDYGKGFVTEKLLQALITQAKKQNILLIADPKGVNFTKYRGVYLIKPNLSEAFAAANLTPQDSLDEAAKRILALVEAEYLMVTRGEAGSSIFSKNGLRQDFPTEVREVKDVTGAGDTVLAMLTLALASGLDLPAAAELSNVAAGIAIEHLGCARISLSELALSLLRNQVGNKVFDEGHMHMLKHALQGQECTVLNLNGSEEVTPEFVSMLCDLKEKKKQKLLISLDHPAPDERFVKMLASLHPVDFVILTGKR